MMLLCVCWYGARPLSLSHTQKMMAERRAPVDHASVHRWAIKMLPVLAAGLRRRKRPVGVSWRMDESYIKLPGQWKYLYRAGDTIDHRHDAHDQEEATRLLRRPSFVRNRPPLVPRILSASRPLGRAEPHALSATEP